MLDATGEAWGLVLLASDRTGRRLAPDRRAAAVRDALTAGTDAARRCRVNGGADLQRLVTQLGVEVVWSDESPVLGALLRIAEYQPRPPTIRLFTESVATIAAAERSLAVADIYTAHELFHHLEATTLGPASDLARVTLARLGRWRWESGVRALSEVAAHAFAQHLLDLPVFPGGLDRLARLLDGVPVEVQFLGDILDRGRPAPTAHVVGEALGVEGVVGLDPAIGAPAHLAFDGRRL
jgi:hypothetical protein